jgi:hypothetical protein
MFDVAGRRTATTRFFNWYVAQLHIGARTDSRMAMAFQNVTNLIVPPQTLLQPRIALSVLSGAWSRQAAKKKASRLAAAEKGAF